MRMCIMCRRARLPRPESSCCNGSRTTSIRSRRASPTKRMARAIASVFCDALLRNGTTTACVYCAVYPQSVDALFEEALKRNLRLVAGKCMMDRNVPEALRDTAQSRLRPVESADREMAREGAIALRRHAALGRARARRRSSRRRARFGGLSRTSICKRISPRTATRSPSSPSFFPSGKTSSTSTIITGWSGGGRCSAMASGFRTRNSPHP